MSWKDIRFCCNRRYPRATFQKAPKIGLQTKNQCLGQYGPLIMSSPAVLSNGAKTHMLHTNVLSYIAGAYSENGGWTSLIDIRLPLGGNHLCWWGPSRKPAGKLQQKNVVHLHVICGIPKCSFKWISLACCHVEKEFWGQLLRLWHQPMYQNHFGANFCSENVSPLGGLYLKAGDMAMRLLFTLKMLLQDGSAQKMTFCNRQDAGSRVCMLCKNIFCIGRGWRGATGI